MGEMIRRRTVFSLVTIVLFALRAWTMFYLMRLVNLGSYSVLTISFLLCAITAILFFGSPYFRPSWGRMVAIFQAVCDPLILFLLEGASCVWCVESTPIVLVGECSFFVRTRDHCLFRAESESSLCYHRIDCPFVHKQPY